MHPEIALATESSFPPHGGKLVGGPGSKSEPCLVSRVVLYMCLFDAGSSRRPDFSFVRGETRQLH